MIDRYNPQSRYRRRSQQRFYSFLFLLLTLGFAVGVGYWFGGQSFSAQIKSQERQISTLEQDTEELRTELTEALTQKEEADLRYNALQTEMESLVPSKGPLRGLLDLVKARLDEGANPERLSFVIRSARPPRNCTDPNTKRFVVATPAYKGPDGVVSLDDGMVVVTAKGDSARNSSGQPEAWFDVGQPVTVTFEKFGGEEEVKTGTLPLSTSMIIKDREYRFTLSEGAKSFLKVTYDSCDYP